MTITITPTQLLPLQVRVQKPLDLKTLFSATDDTGTIDHYKITAGAGFSGTITDTTNGHSITAGQTLTEASTDNFVYTASSSVGSESFTIQASDDTGVTYSNAVTASENVVADTAPTVMAVANNANTITVNRTFSAAQLFQATDINFDPIATYTITTPAAGSGTFALINGATTLDHGNITGTLAAGTAYSISGADLANLTFRTGSQPGSAGFQVAASDGLQTGATLSVTLDVRSNTVPTVTTPAPTSPILIGNGFTKASSLIQSSDLDGSSLAGYTIQVTGNNNGFFTLTHDTTPVALDGNNQFFVTAAQFANLEYVSNLTTAGTDSFNITAVYSPDSVNPNNVVFSPVTPLSVKVAATSPAVVTQSAGATGLGTGMTVAASTLFTAADPKGGPVKGYSIIPTGAGQFTLNGAALAANTPTFVSAADFPNLRYVASATPGSQTFQVAATDGISLGNFTTVTVTTVAAQAPVVTTPASVPSVEPNNPVLASSLFNGTESGGTIQGFSIVVPSTIGHLTLNGTSLATDQPVFVGISDFANLKFVATAAPGSATIQAAAYDGKVFSSYQSVPVNLVGPTVAKSASIGPNGLITNGIYNASSLFTLNAVSGGAAVTGLSIQTPPASQGSFFDGSTQLAAGQPVFINAADLANLTLHVSNSAGPVNFQVSAFDGIAFGKPTQFSLTSVANSEPTVASAQANAQVTVGHTVLASSLFTATDINSDAIAAYEITPGTAPGAGVFSGSGLSFTPGQATSVTAAQFATLSYTAGGPSPTITLAGNVQQPGAFPGTAAIPGTYSVTTDDGASYTATLQLNFAADATSADLQIATLTPVGSAPAVTAGLPLTLGTVAFDGSNNATGFTPAAAAVAVSATGKLLLGSGSLKFTGLTDTAAATTATGSVQSFQTGQDSFTVKARDANAANFASSTAATIKVFATANQAPTAVALPQNLPILTGSQIAAASLFSASDPEGDAIKGYSIVPPPASVGSFSGFTSQDPATGFIYVSAADLANLRFNPTAAGHSSFQISAFDGNSWSTAAAVPLNIADPQPAKVTLTPPGVLRPNATIAASALFSASDPRGATIQGYSITTPTGNNGYFTLGGVQLPSNTQNYISAAQLSSLAFVAGPKAVAATFTVAAFNGTSWTDLSTEPVNIANYTSPVVTAATGANSVGAGGSINVSALIKSVTTDTTTSVQQYVVSASAGSFRLDGSTVSATTPFTVSAADLANLQYVADAQTGTVTLNIAANDGTSTGNSTPITVNVSKNAGPTVSLLPPPQLVPGQPVPVTQLFSASDNTGNTISSYVVQINSGNGTFQLNGAALPTTGPQTVNAGDLGKLTFVPGDSVTSFTVSANDAIANGQPTTLVLSTTQSPDSIVVPANPLPSVAHNTTIPVKQLLSGIAGTGKTIQGFNISSDSGGQFLLNNVALTAGQASLVSAADFANLVFSAPNNAGTVHITSSAFDGDKFGPALTIALSIT